MNIRIRVLDVAELNADQWYIDMHRGNYKPQFPMAGIIEYETTYGEWKPIQVIPPPVHFSEIAHTYKYTISGSENEIRTETL